MQHRLIAACRDRRCDRAHQPSREALPPGCLVGANGADLGPAGRAHPLSRHRDQCAVTANAEIAAELVRPRFERPWARAPCQFEHVAGVIGAERHDLRILTGRDALGEHLEPRPREGLCPGSRDTTGPEHHGRAGRPEQLRQIVPGRVVVIGESDEGRHRRIESGSASPTQGERLLGTGQGEPDRIVEHGLIDDGHAITLRGRRRASGPLGHPAPGAAAD